MVNRLIAIVLVLVLIGTLTGPLVAAQEDSCGFFCKIGNFFFNIFFGFTGSAVLDATSAPFPALDDENKTISISVKVAKG